MRIHSTLNQKQTQEQMTQANEIGVNLSTADAFATSHKLKLVGITLEAVTIFRPLIFT